MQAVAERFAQLLEKIGVRMTIPPVRALVVPKRQVRSAKDAEFCALQLADGSTGLTFALLGDTLAALDAGVLPSLAGADALYVARWYGGADALRHTIGFAAVNAISQFFFRRAACELAPAPGSLGLLDPKPGDHVGMIGLFPPLVEQIVARGADLTVAELKAELVQQHERYRVVLGAENLAGCNKILSTGTVLLNDTLDEVLAACRGAEHFGIIGPSAGCLPDPLFERGVDAVCGSEVIDADGLRNAILAGESWGRYARKYCIRHADYPGVEALLARLD